MVVGCAAGGGDNQNILPCGFGGVQQTQLPRALGAARVVTPAPCASPSTRECGGGSTVFSVYHVNQVHGKGKILLIFYI